MRGIIAGFSLLTGIEEKWKPLLNRLETQVHEDCAFGYGISDAYGPCLAIYFNLDETPYTIYPEQNVLFVGDTEKILKLKVDDDWVIVRLKMAQATLRLDGAVPEPGPDLVQWLRQQMSCSATIEGVTDSDWTFERCIKEAAAHLLVPPDQPSTQDLPSDNTEPNAAPERALPPGNAEALKLRLIAFGLQDPNTFPNLFPFLKWSAEQDDVNWDNLWEWFSDWADHSRDEMLRRWGVTPSNRAAVDLASRQVYDVRHGITRALNGWTRGDYHTEEMVVKLRSCLQALDELGRRVDEI